MKFLVEKLGKSRVFFGSSLANYTTWGIGGPAWCLVKIHSIDEAIITLAVCRFINYPVKILGLGSNILVQDNGYSGLILKMVGSLAELKVRNHIVKAGGGVSLSAVVKLAAYLGLTGLEWAVGIPGSVGGAIATNAGAYGKNIAEVATRIILLTPNGDILNLAGKNIPAAYRYRELPIGSLVLGVYFVLAYADPLTVMQRVSSILAVRKRAQPLGHRSAGSVFKNPSNDYSAGWLIETAGLKGLAVGRAQVSYKHANFIINQGGASALEIMALMAKIQLVVMDQFKIKLIPEVEILGNS